MMKRKSKSSGAGHKKDEIKELENRDLIVKASRFVKLTLLLFVFP